MTMIRRFLLTAIAASLSLATSFAALADTPDTKLILDKLAALEARVATLETKNQQYKRELEQARADARRRSTAEIREANAAVAPRGEKLGGPRREEPSWTGAFWGASAGGAATRSSVSNSEHVSSGPIFYDSVGASGPTGRGGGFIDVYAGYDVQLSRAVVGGQLEVTAADIDFSSSGVRNYTYSSGATAVGDFKPQVTSRWLASGLLRAGVLLDDRTMLYGLGGWTFAQLENRNVTDNPFYQPTERLWANGPTGGVGIERKLDPNWRLRAEYRYTHLRGHVEDQTSFVSTNAFAQLYARSAQFDQSMQTGRVGVAYSFRP
ncbi:hypothetical protein BKD09_07395 [Bradyrhizobium japonicum]|uniref:Outer membrane protein beta-barrel domain-containing protein n=1 Tax=Bradyrhizobium japonicum TaxID=375 RepID=A0A1L3F4B1_BRAJP|nr:outer membrane beta-barrel protein [Bradyrhizobium japonicum]APG08149.1 hypothetical protein BKD09_07395 [Bradyrhizobium japonicum]